MRRMTLELLNRLFNSATVATGQKRRRYNGSEPLRGRPATIAFALAACRARGERPTCVIVRGASWRIADPVLGYAPRNPRRNDQRGSALNAYSEAAQQPLG